MEYEAKKEAITITNICGGSVEDIFQREWRAVMANVVDINTPPDAKRKITLEFTISPFGDRSGAIVTFACKSKTMPVEEVTGQIFLYHEGASLVAVPHDPKQARLFDPAVEPVNEHKN